VTLEVLKDSSVLRYSGTRRHAAWRRARNGGAHPPKYMTSHTWRP